jgi:competence protein ComFC
MIDSLLGFIAPHYCISCAKLGTVLCDSCRYDIVPEQLLICPTCQRVLVGTTCTFCPVTYSYFGAFFKREGVIKQLIDQYKFSGVRPLAKVAAELLDDSVPYFPGKVVYINIPTSRNHVRERGFDHMDAICRYFSQIRKADYLNLLERTSNVHQVGTRKSQRKSQVKNLYICRKQLDESITYVLIDDVVTTGATLQASSQALYDAGARKIAVITLAYQPSN